jgi:hypothetical protein
MNIFQFWRIIWRIFDLTQSFPYVSLLQMSTGVDLEAQIKELERKLALKKAYLSVEIKLPKGLPDELRTEIEMAVKTFCTSQANDVPQSSSNILQNGLFTTQEVAVLKSVVQAAIDKTGGKPIQSVAKPAEKPKPLTAILMTTDSIPNDRRKLISSNEKVTIVSYNDKEACFMYGRDRFVVPIEDLQFETEETK